MSNKDSLEKSIIDVTWTTFDEETSSDVIAEELISDLPPVAFKHEYPSLPADATTVLKTWQQRRAEMLAKYSARYHERSLRFNTLSLIHSTFGEEMSENNPDDYNTKERYAYYERTKAELVALQSYFSPVTLIFFLNLWATLICLNYLIINMILLPLNFPFLKKKNNV